MCPHYAERFEHCWSCFVCDYAGVGVCFSGTVSVRCVSFSQVLLKSMAQQVPAVSMAFTPVKVSSPSSSLFLLSLLLFCCLLKIGFQIMWCLWFPCNGHFETLLRCPLSCVLCCPVSCRSLFMRTSVSGKFAQIKHLSQHPSFILATLVCLHCIPVVLISPLYFVDVILTRFTSCFLYLPCC